MNGRSPASRVASLLGRLVDDVRYRRVPGKVRILHELHLLRARGRALLAPVGPVDEPEIHVFVLWSNALPQAPRILDDIASEFEILEVGRVPWPRQEFTWNLTRFYGGTLPPRAEKERHCGSDPFLVVVAEDRAPVYEPRRSSKGIVNARTFDAKQRYRRWTGGGHRVHASTDRAEAEHDLFLLSGRPAASYAGAPPWNGETTEWPAAVTGASGWRDSEELLQAVSVATDCVRVDEVGDGEAGGQDLILLVRNPLRAALTANLRVENGDGTGRHETLVGGRRTMLELRRLPR